MKRLMLIACLAATAPALAATPEALDGPWSVDLSTDPAEPYAKTMLLLLAPDGSVSGSFYDSAIEAGRWKQDRGRLCVSFRTTDGVGPYHSSACLRGDRVEGQTWAEHRNFLFNWNATRAP
ncbi:hypothetical protein [Sphingobium sp.]|uniref:hypothetical protein n=1 Tax=Sphingobium sp. TaxID=1912891 RepID=UPI002E2096C4